MNDLYIVSTEEYSGKSSLCLSLSLMLKEKRQSVAYMKPIGTIPTKVESKDTCEDVDYIWNTLGRPGELEDICPVVLLAHFIEKMFSKTRPDYLDTIKKAYQSLKKEYKNVILEGAATLDQGRFIGLSSKQIAKELDLNTLLVAKYSNQLVVDEILRAKDDLGDSMAGVIINVVPQMEEAFVKETVIPFLEKNDVDVLGFLPENKMLLSVSIREVAKYLNGKILVAEDKIDNLIETFMIGAMGQEQAISYFRKKSDKAVITGGDRADVQLAALETPTKALILTGNLNPRPLVLSRAQELGIPVILVNIDTLTAVEKTEELIGRVRIHEAQKVYKMMEMLERNINLKKIFEII
jgi:BioD-like phosphotransacetylase family protein